jgi:hypothetical protein
MVWESASLLCRRPQTFVGRASVCDAIGVDVMWIMSFMTHCIMRIFESSCRDFAKVQRNPSL